MKVKFSIVLLVLSLFIYFAGCIDPKAKVSSTVSDPVISPQGGIYDSAQTVSISCPTSGAQIRYSVDGEDPTESSGIVYSGPFSVSDDAAVKAIAYRSGWKSSSVVFESFIIDETIYTVAVPEISPVSGTYTSAQAVTISCTTEDSTIMYTVDGSTPDESGGIEYTGSFIVSSNTTVRAVAFRDGWETSSVAVADYIITGTVADPVISPDAGTYTSAQTVSISCATGGAAIHYTIDGSIPDESSGIVYSGPFSVASTATVRAIAVLAGWDYSSVVSSSYVITGTAAAPVFSPDSGTYTTAQSITLSTATASASIRYTTNGNDPDETYGILYSGPFTVSSDTTVKAVAFLDEWETSAVSSAEYIITGTVADPLISPAGGTYTSAQSVSISCSTGGAAIKYTTDGSTPSESNGTVY